MPTDLKRLIEKAEGFIVLRMPAEAWQALEDLPSEAKNLPRVLELRLACLGMLKEWQKVVFLGEVIVQLFPESAQVHFWLACGLAQSGRNDEAMEHAKTAAKLNADLRMQMLDEEALSNLW
jgi:hypothetical protein